MHPECYEWTRDCAHDYFETHPVEGLQVVEIGSRDVNGSVRDIFKGCTEFVGTDIADGPGVDLVVDAADDVAWPFQMYFDVALCLEVLEHAPRWTDIVANMYLSLKKNGLAIITAACEPRLPHSAIDGHNMEPDEDEYYSNIVPDRLQSWMHALGFQIDLVSVLPRGDVQVRAFKQ